MSIQSVNPKSNRHDKNANDVRSELDRCINTLDGQISGFVVMAWDDTGRTSCSLKSGGIISQDAIPLHAFSTTQKVV